MLEQATTYLRISALGIPAMLVILAVTGVLRGLQDTTTPLVASVVGFGANIALNLVFVYGLHWGIAGSAWGTVIAQTGMGIALVTVLLVKARARHARLRPHPARVLAAGRTGIPLLVRTLALRATLLVTTWVAASLGDVPLAAHQVAMTVWSFLAFALDALAIAAQAITGRALGAGDREGVRLAMGTMVRWGVWGGLALGLVIAGAALGRCRRSSPRTRPSRRRSARPSSSSGSARPWRATSSSSTACSSAPATAGGWPGAWSSRSSPTSRSSSPCAAAGPSGSATRDVVVLWLAFTAFMVIRGVVLGWRARRDDWMVIGAR